MVFEVSIKRYRLNPEVVFATGGVQGEAVKQLTDLGVGVIVLDASSVDDVLAAIELVDLLPVKL